MKVAYDISFLARHFGRPDAKCGIVRYIEEGLYALMEVGDIEPLLTAFSDTPAVETLVNLSMSEKLIQPSAKAASYLRANPALGGCELRNAFSSRLKLTPLYNYVYGNYLSAEFHELPRLAAKPIFIKAVRRLLARLSKYDVYGTHGGGDFDIFHSPAWHSGVLT